MSSTPKATNKVFSLGDQARYLFLAKIITFAFQFLTPVILTRLFTVKDYGIYRQILVFTALFPQILNLGLPNSLFYYYPIIKDEQKRRQLLSQTFYLVVFIGIIFLLAFFPFQEYFFHLFDLDFDMSKYVIPAGLLILFTLAALTLENLFIVEQRSDKMMIYTIVNGVARFGMVVLAVMVFRDVSYQVWVLVLVEFLRTVFLFLYLKIKYRINIAGIDRSFTKEQIKYSAPMGIGTAISGFANKMETYMMLLFLNPIQFAIYSIANFRLPHVNLLAGSVANVAMLRISEFAEQNRNDESKTLWHKAIIQQACITIPSVILFIIIAQPFIILLFTEKYIESILIFRIVLLAPLAQMLSSMIIIRCYNDTRYGLKINIATFIFSILVSYPLIKYFGLIGAAFSGVATFYFTVFLETQRAIKILRLSLRDALPYRQLITIFLVSLLFAVPIYFINFLSLHNLFKISLSALFYFSASFYFFQKTGLVDITFITSKFRKRY